MDKEKLLAKEEREKYKIITVGEFSFKVINDISGLQLFHIEKQVAELVRDLNYVNDNGEFVYVPEEIRYIIGLMHFLVEEPKLTIEEWALVFNRKPNVFLVLAKQVSDNFFNSGSDITGFFSEEILEDVLNKD